MTSRWNSGLILPSSRYLSVPMLPSQVHSISNMAEQFPKYKWTPHDQSLSAQRGGREGRGRGEEEKEDFFFSHSLFILVLVFLELTL